MLNDTQPVPRRSRARARQREAGWGGQRPLWALVALAVLLAVLGITSRVRRRNELAREAQAAAVPLVTTLKPAPSPLFEDLVLQGSVQAFMETPIYARVSGYLRRWYTDIGAPVRKGALLAQIDTPELDQQLKAALHDLDTAEANARLAASTNMRWQGLLAKGAVSQQDADQRQAAAAATAATAAAARAKVQRLRELESFKRVLAPFNGIVTSRNSDVGAAITAGQSPGVALFRLDTLRIYVQVPEAYAPQIHTGGTAELKFSQYPQQSFLATVARTAQALDPIARTLEVELHVDNRRGELLPGAYAKVHFRLPGRPGTLRIPASALLLRSAGLQVATVGPHGRVRLKSIVEGRNFGRSVEVLSGLGPDDEVIANPPDSVTDGLRVRVAQPAVPAAEPLP